MLSKYDYINHITDSLLIASICPVDEFFGVVEYFWGMSNGVAKCNTELQFLHTQKESISYLMSLAAWDVNVAINSSRSESKSDSSSVSDGWNQGTENSHSGSYSDSKGASFSRNDSRSDSFTESTTNSRTEQVQTQHQRSDNETISEGLSGTQGASMGMSRSDSNSRSDSESITGQGDGGRRKGCSYSYNHSNTFGLAAGIPPIPFVGGVSIGRTATRTAGDNWSCEDSTDETIDDSTGTNENHSRAVGQNTSQSRTSNWAYTNALNDTEQWQQQVQQATTETRGQADSDSHGEGESQSQSKSNSRGSSMSASSTQAHSENKSDSRSISTGNSSGYSKKNNQRFQHLKVLYDQTVRMIALKTEMLLKGDTLPLIMNNSVEAVYCEC